jgi:hypothetical protein
MPGEGRPGPNVGLLQGVLHGSHEQADAAGDRGTIDAVADGILGLVLLVLCRRHVSDLWQSGGGGELGGVVQSRSVDQVGPDDAMRW